MRLSELCALTIDALELGSRPAYVTVHGTVYNRRRPKSGRERRIIIDYDVRGFGRGYVGRLRRYIESDRALSSCRELFLSQHRDAKTGEHPALTTIGVQKLMKRLESVSGVHCNPHRLRHTFATRCADAEVPLFQLQEALGHASLDMVRRYYTHSARAMAKAFYGAFGASYDQRL
jgi:integrase